MVLCSDGNNLHPFVEHCHVVSGMVHVEKRSVPMDVLRSTVLYAILVVRNDDDITHNNIILIFLFCLFSSLPIVAPHYQSNLSSQ
jgi:hypothetical protein